MLRFTIVAGFSLLFSFGSNGQLKKFYTIKETCSFDTIDFKLKAAQGNCFIKNYKDSKYPMVIYGNPDLERINPSFSVKFKGRTCNTKLDLEAYNPFEVGDGLAFVMSRDSKEEKGDFWKILVNEKKVYRFNMKYGVGNTEVNLSNVKTNKMWLSSGSANVKIGYDEGQQNLVEMDTFFVKVDMGSIETHNLGNSRASNFVADVGFGTALLDFNGQDSQKLRCDAKIGAGSLDILIPHKTVPVIIYLKNSPFCGIKMEEDFEEVEDNVYVNHSYSAEADNLMVLDIDVALGTFSVSYGR